MAVDILTTLLRFVPLWHDSYIRKTVGGKKTSLREQSRATIGIIFFFDNSCSNDSIHDYDRSDHGQQQADLS